MGAMRDRLSNAASTSSEPGGSAMFFLVCAQLDVPLTEVVTPKICHVICGVLPLHVDWKARGIPNIVVMVPNHAEL